MPSKRGVNDIPTNTPRLGLPKGNGSDSARDYLKGAIAGGGLWKALEVLDDAVLQSSVNTLNDVTLTSPNIGPNEWTDSQHTHASAATAGSTLGPGTTLSTPTLTTPGVTGVMTFTDVTLQRTSAGALRQGGAPAAVTEYRVTGGAGGGRVGQAVSSADGSLWLTTNASYDGANWVRDNTAAGATYAQLSSGSFRVLNAPAAANPITWSAPRLEVTPTGTLTLTPDAGQAALAWSNGTLATAANGNPQLSAINGQSLQLHGAQGYVVPAVDGGQNLGSAGLRWSTVYAITGAINTSLAEAKQSILPLDPAAALAAVLATDPVVFDYKPPERDASYYELPDDPEQAEAVLYQRLTSAPLEAAARHQAGFVLASPDYATDPLFETGAGQSNAANSVGVLIGALHELARRVTALEGA